jgi:small subunit ribosomal protein S16
VSVSIRLRRLGAKKRPYYRIVVADSRSPRDGKFIETIGTYHPIETPTTVKVDVDRALDWLGKGARPSEAVNALFRNVGILQKWHLLRRGKEAEAEAIEIRTELRSTEKKRKKEKVEETTE